MGAGWRGGAKVRDFFSTKNPNHPPFIFFFWGGRGGGGQGGRWMNRRTGPNQFPPFNFFEVGGHNNALMFKFIL